MNPFQHNDQFADGLGNRTAPYFLGAIILILRTRVGLQYVPLGTLAAEFVVTGGVAAILLVMGLDNAEAFPLALNAAAYLLVLVPAYGFACWTQCRTFVRDLRGFSPVHRWFSGIPRLYEFPPNAWLLRLIALEPKRPRTAHLLARLILPLLHVRRWLGRKPVWFLKAVAEPGLLGCVAVVLLLGSWLADLPFWLLGGHAFLATGCLCRDQVDRSLTLYEEVREIEDAAIAAGQLVERMRRRRNGGW
jgi:hypothetical protein